MLCEYEQQREARIAYNRQRLKDLGIDDEVEALRRQHAAKRAQPRNPPPEEPATYIRRSRRLQRKAADVVILETSDEGKENVQHAPKRKSAVPRPAACGYDDGAEYDELSRYRLRTMSEQALLQRIQKITVMPKLMSFARVCMIEERTELARAAGKRLEQVLGQNNP